MLTRSNWNESSSRLTTICVGVGAVIQGAILIVMSFVTFGRAVNAAEILYAEDFDRLGLEPVWFGPWHFAMRQPGLGTAVLFLAGIALVLTGAQVVSGLIGAIRWLEWTCWAAAICSLALAVALIPLYAAGSEWPAETPAGHLRRMLGTSIGVACLEVLTLLWTVIAIRGSGKWEADSMSRSESEA